MSWSIPHRPGNLATDAIPTRMGNQLRYRDGRVTDLQGNPLTEAAPAPVTAADLPTFHVKPAKAPMRALPVRTTPSVIPEKHRKPPKPRPVKAAKAAPQAQPVKPTSRVHLPGRMVIKGPDGFSASLWADGELEIEGLDAETQGFVRLPYPQTCLLAALLHGYSIDLEFPL